MKKLIAKTGGSSGIRDMKLLESAVLNCSQTFNNEDLYPAVIDKVAEMVYEICKNHPFVDGNKRVAVLSMLMILNINGMSMTYTQKELIDLVLGIADSMIDDIGILNWINLHTFKVSVGVLLNYIVVCYFWVYF